MKQSIVYAAPALQGYVSRLGQRLASLSERPDLPWSFTVVDDPAVNAFALPGGFMYVTRALLACLGTEAQLGSLLGHEIGHVTGKNAVEQLSKTQLANVGFDLDLLLSDEARAFGQLGLAGLNLLFLKYSPDDEYQADGMGLRSEDRIGRTRELMAETAPGNLVGTVGGQAYLPVIGGNVTSWPRSFPSRAS